MLFYYTFSPPPVRDRESSSLLPSIVIQHHLQLPVLSSLSPHMISKPGRKQPCKGSYTGINSARTSARHPLNLNPTRVRGDLPRRILIDSSRALSRIYRNTIPRSATSLSFGLRHEGGRGGHTFSLILLINCWAFATAN